MIEDLIRTAALRHGVDPSVLLRIAQIESGLNPTARNPNSTAGGLFQFVDGTAKSMGLADKFDPAQAADAGARLAAQNAAFLRSRLGRDPSGPDLYLAHQQGAGGAYKLLSNPNAPAASIVGSAAAGLNGGAGMTAGDFAAMWSAKFNKTPVPTQTGQTLASAFSPGAPTPPADIGLAIAQTMQQTQRDRQQRQEQQKAEQERRAALFGDPELAAILA